jgi:hypothetical protein
VVFAADNHLFAQNTDSSSHKGGLKAHSIAISDTQIVFQVAMPSGEIFDMAVEEGAMAKTSDSSLRTSYAFVPVLTSGKKESVDFTVFLINEDKEGNESLRQVERMTGILGRSASLRSQPKLQIRLTAINPRATQASLSNRKAGPAEIKIEMGPAVDCCIKCGDFTTCALAVCTSCGTHCEDSPPGLPCGGETINMPFDLNKHHSKLALFASKDEDVKTEAAQTQNQQ